MVYLKLYESFNEIDAICEKYGISNYTINVDGSVDVDGGVDISSKGLTKIPLRFGRVGGNFNCSYNHKLTSLGGCPKEVGWYFSCSYNQLTSLEGCPIKVGGSFNCDNNILTSIKGPININGYFNCARNLLTSLDGCPKEVGGGFFCDSNPVYSVYKLIDRIVNKDYFNLIEFVENWNPIRSGKVIILDRLNDYLETFGGEPVTSVKGYKCI